MKLLSKMMNRAGIATSALVLAAPAIAGTTGTEFTALYNMVKGWSEGYLGRTLAIAAFLVGAIVGHHHHEAVELTGLAADDASAHA